MMQTMKTPIRLGFLATLFLFAACAEDGDPTAVGDDAVDGTASLETVDLDAAYGDLAWTDEGAGFEDDVLLAAATFDEQAALTEDDEDSLVAGDDELAAADVRRTVVRIVWGQLDGSFATSVPREDAAALDWSGSASVTAGAVALKRTILFERPLDHRLPRDARDSLAWKSATGPHYDGVLLVVLSPVVDGAAQGELVFETAPFSVRLRVDELDGYDALTAVDAEGNAIAIRAAVVPPQDCTAGFLAGFWKDAEDRPATDAIEAGVFRGRAVVEAGVTVGFLKGVYGWNSAGERVLVGKLVGRAGRIRGLVSGTWAPDGDTAGLGSFQAHWIGRTGAREGTLGGRYLRNAAAARGDGFFEGRFREFCANTD